MSGRDELTGRALGEFILRERIGEGGFGAVYRCEQPLLAREAVIKVLHRGLRAQEVIVQRFLREARLASRLDHPYAAHVYAFGVEKEDGLLWIAMEMVHGTPFDRWLRERGALPLRELVPFFERIAEVVHTAHERGIVHRDIKPSNVMMIERAGRLLPKLLDFGIAKLLGGSPEPPEPRSALARSAPGLAGARTLSPESEVETLTVSHHQVRGVPLEAELTDPDAAMGSPPYMAPEQWDNDLVGPPADLYALGVMAYEALTGRRPFSAATIAGYAQLHATADVPPLGDGFPAALDRWFQGALAKQAAARPASALELAAGLRIACGLADAPTELPRLERGVRDAWLADAPQPLAEAVAALDAARNLHQARDAARELARSVLRYVLVLALAARAQVRGEPDAPAIGELLRTLRRRDLQPDERIALLRHLVRPFAAHRDAHPIPALVDFVSPRAATGADALEAILELTGEGSSAGLADERLRSLLTRQIVELNALLRAAAFVLDHPLVVSRGGAPERWIGPRRAGRAVAATAGAPLVDGQPVLLDRDGRAVLALWPLAQALAPAPGGEPELFMLDGRGRYGARMVAAPVGFERHDAAVWDWLGDHVLDPDPSEPPAAGGAEAPYLGLATFTAADAERFVGRERETDALLNRLRVSALQLVVGASGAGKSSFVHAGVIPALPRSWRVIAMRPGAAPITTLAARLATAELSAAELRPMLETAPAALSALLLTRAGGDGGLALFVDQLEELFTRCADEVERVRFASVLAELSQAPERPLRVICTVRDDFLMRVESLSPLGRRVSPAVFLLGNPSRDDLARTVVEPARRAGYALSDPELAQDMAAEVAERPGALALLSFTASRLWELRDRRFRQLTRRAYDAMGGVAGALSRHAESTLEALGPGEQRLARDALRRLINADGTRGQASLAELHEVLASERAERVIARLIDARLLVVLDGDGGPQVELAHEALIAAWPRLRQWIREDAEGARMREQLRAAARQWAARGRSRGLLWRADALAELERWRRDVGAGLTSAEVAFADASRADAARGRAVRRLIAIAAFAVLGAALLVLLRLNGEANAQRRLAEENERHATSSAQEAARSAAELQRRLAAQAREQGRLALLAGHASEALAQLLAALDLGAARDPALDFLLGEATRPVAAQRAVMRGHQGPVWAIERAGDRVVSAGEDGTVRRWAPGTSAGAVIASLPRPARALRISPTGRHVAVADRDGGVRLYTIEGALVRELQPPALPPAPGRTRAPAFRPDGEQVAAVDNRGVLRVWHVDGRLALEQPVDASADLVAWSGDGRALAVAGAVGVELRDAAGALRARLAHADRVSGLAFSPDGRLLATCSWDHTAAIWSVATGALLARLEGHSDYLDAVAFDPTGRLVVTGSRDTTARVWDVATGRPRAILGGHDAPIWSVAFDAAGERVLTAGGDGVVRVWEADGSRLLVGLEGGGAAVRGALFMGDDVIGGGTDGAVRRWRVEPTVRSFRAPSREVPAVALSADGRRLVMVGDARARLAAVAGGPVTELGAPGDQADAAGFFADGDPVVLARDGSLRRWRGGTASATFAARGVSAFAISSDRTAVVTGGEDGALAVWGPDAALRATWPPLRSRIRWLACSPRGDAVLAVTHDRVELRDAASGQALAALDADRLNDTAFSPSGELVATANHDAAQLWDRAGHLLRRLRGHLERITTVAFDATGARLVTASVDGTVRVWRVVDGQLLATLAGHAGAVVAARFDPRGLVLSIGIDNTLKVWDPGEGKLLGSYFSHRGGVLSLALVDGGVVTSGRDGFAVWRALPRTLDLAAARALAACLVRPLAGSVAPPPGGCP